MKKIKKMNYPFLRGMQVRVVNSPSSYFRVMWQMLMQYLLRDRTKRVRVSLGDYMLRRESLSQFQFGIAGHCLDIDHYINDGDTSFFYHKAKKIAWYGKEFDTTKENICFQKTLDSVLKNGYDENSFVELDKDITIQDGTHRTAILVCVHHYDVIGLRVPYRFRWFDNADSYIENVGLDSKIVSDIKRRYEEIEKDLINVGSTFAVYTPESFRKEVENQLNRKDIRMLRQLKSKQGGWYYQFVFYKPDYRVEGESIISRAAEKLERNLKKSSVKDFRVAKNCTEGMKMYADCFLKHDE